MSNFKLNILLNIQKGPWGGGNQFLKALKKKFISKGIYETNPKKADLILFNSFPFGEEFRFLQIYLLKKMKKLLIHRVDGPISQIRGRDYEIDKIIYLLNDFWADGTIFQSKWSKEQNIRLGMKKNKYETIVINAPDASIFNNENKRRFEKKRKIQLIATSWSPNWSKGFEIYQYLDKELDFSKYDFTFIGNSPINFKNIKWIKPIRSQVLVHHLKKNDIFVTASKNDPCSNSLIEALHCGLPAIVLDDGGHPELIGKAGEVFQGSGDVIEKIQKVTQNYEFYQNNIKLPSLNEIAEKYLNFIGQTYEDFKKKVYQVKKNRFFGLLKILFSLFKIKIKNKEVRQIYYELLIFLKKIVKYNSQ